MGRQTDHLLLLEPGSTESICFSEAIVADRWFSSKSNQENTALRVAMGSVKKLCLATEVADMAPVAGKTHWEKQHEKLFGC